jgi:putative AlgH/UPF0301 family transcriptional regulator
MRNHVSAKHCRHALLLPLHRTGFDHMLGGMVATVPTDMTGQLLIAMPGMGDPRFDGGVVFLCAHSDNGAMGLMVNKAVAELTFAEMIEQLGITADHPPELAV